MLHRKSPWMYVVLVSSLLLGGLYPTFIVSAQSSVYLPYLGGTSDQSTPSGLTPFPSQASWLDCGQVLTAGAEGEWDVNLWGGFANGVVKKDDTYFLYYQGASNFDASAGTSTWRAIGVATSKDGIHFTKYEHNPVITWFPQNNLVEGAVSSGAFLDENDNISVYYGANTASTGIKVNADGRLAISSDGFAFTDQGVVLDHTNSSVWGGGDQLYPIIGLQYAGRWFTYYIPDGTPQRGQLGVAWGDQRDALTHTSAATDGGSAVPVWGSGSSVWLGDDEYALFLNNMFAPSEPLLEVRTVSLSAPDRLSAPLKSYHFDDVRQATVFLDREKGIWFMYYRSLDGDDYGVKVAPANEQKVSCSM